MKYYDLSPRIDSQLGVFPGDQKFIRKVSMDTDKGDHLGLSSITTTLHLGAHTDAPCHYGPHSPGMDQVSLEYYWGKAQVITISGQPERVRPEHVTCKIQAPRLLFRTDSFPDPYNWNSDFSALSPELIHWASQQGVILFGIDTPSVDPESSKSLPSHQALLETRSAVLEGIVLSEVPDGVYILSALPLNLKDADASPVRAVLWEETELLNSLK